ncbi:MAG: molybdopterin-guanine dinucleotide biosynthesis protein B [Lachnospiraceae bacterium]|jgi:molybdopterin-guanine dinucleotide biosynthesis protein MobB|nr:molybdopterin-guanine dinucleotide biosynthesis protein B [Lachnospiraceae bacterium]
MADVTVSVLAGGDSSRMGENKALLWFDGKTFLAHLTQEFAPHHPVVISTNGEYDYTGYPFSKLDDAYAHIGAMGGIYTSLRDSRTEMVFVVSCDTPEVTVDFLRYLLSFDRGGLDALVPVAVDGRICPTAAVYKKSALPAIEGCIESGNYRLRDMLQGIRTQYIPLGYTVFPDTVVESINTPEAYRAFLTRHRTCAMVAISGVKNSGKTTLITKLLAELGRRGYKAAAIKHDGHDFSGDVPGTDSYRFFEAGACGTAVYSSTKFMLLKQTADADAAKLAAFFPEADVILLEGQKHSAYPKIEVVRGAVSGEPVCARETLLALASDCLEEYGGIPVFPPDAVGGICDVIEGYMASKGYGAVSSVGVAKRT